MALQLKQVVTAAPIVAEPDPNTTPPASERVFRSETFQNLTTGEGRKLAAYLLDGTSVAVTVWALMSETDTWVQVLGPATALALAQTVLGPVPTSADLFAQLTAPVGAPTTVGFAYL